MAFLCFFLFCFSFLTGIWEAYAFHTYPDLLLCKIMFTITHKYLLINTIFLRKGLSGSSSFGCFYFIWHEADPSKITSSLQRPYLPHNETKQMYCVHWQECWLRLLTGLFSEKTFILFNENGWEIKYLSNFLGGLLFCAFFPFVFLLSHIV